MGLSGASLNRQSLSNFATLNEIRKVRLADSGIREVAFSPLIRLRVPLVQQTVEKIVIDSVHPVRLAEIKPLAEEILGQPLKRAAIKSALGVLAQNKSPVVRVSRGLYSHAIAKQSSKTQNQKQHE